MRPAQSLVALTVLVWLLALPERVEAQAINSNATIYVTPTDGADEDKLENGSIVYINKTQCDGTWRFALQGYATAVPYLEMWGTNNTSTNCADQANRSSPTSTQPICWKIGDTQNAVRGNTSFSVKGGQIFNSSRDGATCDDGIAGTKYKVQFVTLDSPTQGNTSAVTASNNNPNQVSAIFTLYSKVPVAPGNVRSRSGGRTIGIAYDKIDNDPLTEYRAFFDHDPNAMPIVGPDGGDIDAGTVSCGTGLLDRVAGTTDAGGTVPRTGSMVTVDDMTTFRSGTTKGESVSISDLDNKGIEYNTYTAVSVYAIDGARNAGQLSDPICVKRVRTLGYLESCRDAGVDCGDLESCSLSPRNAGSAFWLSACTLAISAWARRRRRSV